MSGEEPGRIVSWQYGLTREAPDGEAVYTVRELYLDAGGQVVAWNETADHASGATTGELVGQLRRMMDAVRASTQVFDLEMRRWAPREATDETGTV